MHQKQDGHGRKLWLNKDSVRHKKWAKNAQKIDKNLRSRYMKMKRRMGINLFLFLLVRSRTDRHREFVCIHVMMHACKEE